MLAWPSSVSAFKPEPPVVASSAGAHLLPSHLRTCPAPGPAVDTSAKPDILWFAIVPA